MLFFGTRKLNFNNLNGTIPVDIEDLKYLTKMLGEFLFLVFEEIYHVLSFSYIFRFRDLSVNSLSGVVPNEICDIATLQVLFVTSFSYVNETLIVHISSDLHSNLLTGTILSEMGSLRSLKELFVLLLISSTLYREIDCSFIRHLNVNSLTGTIPSEIGDLKILGELFVSLLISD